MSDESDNLFGHLSEKKHKTYLETLRNAVEPILGNNLHPHLTDHSVSHSDRLIAFIRHLQQPLVTTGTPLTSSELTILYSACYLHDLGMQFETAGQTTTIAELDLPQPWNDLSEESRRNLLRKNHHKLSAEIVRSSMAPHPLIRLAIPDEYKPDCIAALCEAHCVDVDSERYRNLTQSIATVRMDLLSALLRVADLLDESRRRALPEKARMLLLDVTSQVHWWRHYYTEDVTIDQAERTICLHFDFPKDRREEYSGLLPFLQVPIIEEELGKHTAVFNRNGGGWTVRCHIPDKVYSTVEAMPEDVLSEMMKQLYRRRTLDAEQRKHISLQSFRAGQPIIDRRLDELRDQRTKLSPSEYFLRLWRVGLDLEQFGARRSAWYLVWGEFNKTGASLGNEQRLRIGSWLTQLMLEDDCAEFALRTIRDVEGLAQNLPPEDETRKTFELLWIRTLVENHLYGDAVSAMQTVLAVLEDSEARANLISDLCELHLLQGELSKALECAKLQGMKQ
jgi:hypothetical protein